MNQNLRVNKTNFNINGFAPGFVSSDLDVPRGARLSNTRSHSATARPSKVATRSFNRVCVLAHDPNAMRWDKFKKLAPLLASGSLRCGSNYTERQRSDINNAIQNSRSILQNTHMTRLYITTELTSRHTAKSYSVNDDTLGVTNLNQFSPHYYLLSIEGSTGSLQFISKLCCIFEDRVV